jgi:hypothetical protein
MTPAEPDQDAIQNTAMARQLASLVLSAQLGAGTASGQSARRLALEVLGLDGDGVGLGKQVIVTEGTTRTAALDEPVFPILGRDVVSGDAVRAWIELARKAGAESDILHSAALCAARMDSWQPKKVPDLLALARPAEAAKPAPAYRAASVPIQADKTVAHVESLTTVTTADQHFHLLHYALARGVIIAEIDTETFWGPLAGLLAPGDVIFVTAALPDGSVLTEARSVAQVTPFVRVRKLR